MQYAMDRFFLPIRDGGDGFISAIRTCEAAFIGSLAQSAHHMKLIYGDVFSDSNRERWESLEICKAVLERVKQHTNIKPEDINVSNMWQEPKWGLQNKITRAWNAIISDMLLK
jgi:hypothetical protein